MTQTPTTPAATEAAAARDFCPSRRAVLRTLAGVGVATISAGVLVACGSQTQDFESGPVADPTSDGSATGSPTPGATPSVSGTIPASEVPVGEARVVDAAGQPVVVAQPAAGEYVAFSAVCTHQGTTVGVEEGLLLRCPNHGSGFDAADGSVVNGPAQLPLPSLAIRVEGDQLVLG